MECAVAPNPNIHIFSEYSHKRPNDNSLISHGFMFASLASDRRIPHGFSIHLPEVN